MIVAVVPVAFYTEGHVNMTACFLDKLHGEVDRIGVWHNGGPLADTGWEMLRHFFDLHLEDAGGWPFFRMWNKGIRWARKNTCLVVNNDIEWDSGALRVLGEELERAPEDVAIMSPCPGGEPRWCFAIRPEVAPVIDERYRTWFGDTELEYAIKAAGYECRQFDPGIRHPTIQTTTDYIPGIQEMRQADRRLFLSRWASA